MLPKREARQGMGSEAVVGDEMWDVLKVFPGLEGIGAGLGCFSVQLSLS